MTKNDVPFMREALIEAQIAYEQGEIPIGGVMAHHEKIIARAHNKREQSQNPLHHAEILLLEKAALIIGNWRLKGTSLYITVEPCPMCLGALLQARVDALIMGCFDPKRKKVCGHEETSFVFPSLKKIKTVSGNNHVLEIRSGVLEKNCSQKLKDFFKTKREG